MSGQFNISRELLTLYVDNLSLEYAQSFSDIVETGFQWMPYVPGIPQLILNLVVLLSIGAILRGGRYTLEKPAFLFIANLAVSDLVMWLLEVLTVVLRDEIQECTTRKCRLQTCQLQLSMWTFTLSKSLLSTILITVDRYIYITQGIKYGMIVTKSWILIGIAVVWVTPFILALTSALIQEDRTGTETFCVFTHLMPTVFIALGIAVILIVLACIYLSYGVILFKFYQQKKALEAAKTNTQSIRFKRFSTDSQMLVTPSMGRLIQDIQKHEPPSPMRNFRRKRISGEFSLIFQTLKKVGRFIHAAQYVIFLVMVFTLAWLPWIVILYSDVFGDNFGSDYESICPNDTKAFDAILPQGLDLSNIQSHLQHVITHPHDVILLDISPKLALPTCTLVHKAVHSFVQYHRQMSAALVGIWNSVLNPIIYAFWYSEFREQCKNISCRLPWWRLSFPLA